MEPDELLQELARRAAKGDRGALREIYQRTADRLFREVLAPILASRAACEDALKETFVTAIEKAAQLDRGEVYPFLATIARNKALDRRRRLATEGRFQAARKPGCESTTGLAVSSSSATQISSRSVGSISWTTVCSSLARRGRAICAPKT